MEPDQDRPAGARDPIIMNVVIALPLAPRGPSYTMVRVVEAMQGPGVAARLYAPVNRWPDLAMPVATGGIGGRWIESRLGYRLLGPALQKRVEERMRSDLAAGQLVYTWGEVSLELSRRLHAEGITVVREKYNCAKRVAKDILDRAYARFGLSGTTSITERMIAKEQEELELADAVFSPSPMVADSLARIGIPQERILPASYGWEPARLSGDDRALEAVDGPTLLFVGYSCVRKGTHILLEAWAKAGIKGRLVLAGDMEPLIRERYADVLGRADVLHIPFTKNVGALYRSADWLIFPTLEEGSPLVTYEAAGCGLPVIVSPMGAGAFVRDGLEGLVIASEEVDAWADVIRSVPDRAREQGEYAERARLRGLDFTYDQVGERRRMLLLDRFG
jgi:glycosyltransferase involved in cell wall biosynthesis